MCITGAVHNPLALKASQDKSILYLKPLLLLKRKVGTYILKTETYTDITFSFNLCVLKYFKTAITMLLSGKIISGILRSRFGEIGWALEMHYVFASSKQKFDYSIARAFLRSLFEEFDRIESRISNSVVFQE